MDLNVLVADFFASARKEVSRNARRMTSGARNLSSAGTATKTQPRTVKMVSTRCQVYCQ